MGEVRPQTFDDIIGQETAKKILQLRVAAFTKTKQCSGHMLFLGNAGLGKTSLALCTANEMGVKLHTVLGTRINKWSDLLSYLNKLKKNDILFIDEIHALSSTIQEELYGVMEDFRYEEKDRFGRPSMNKMPKFTLIGATTHAGLLNAPLRRRFPLQIELIPYTIDQLSMIIQKAAYKSRGFANFPVMITDRLAHLAKGNAANSVNLFKNLIEVADGLTTRELTPSDINSDLLDELLRLQGLDPVIGLDRLTRRYLSVLVTESRPFGVNALANILNEQPETITGMIESFLTGNLIDTEYEYNGHNIVLEGPFVRITRMGRQITDSGREYLKLCVMLQSDGWMINEKINTDLIEYN